MARSMYRFATLGLPGYFGYRITRERDNVALGDVPRRTLMRGFELLALSFRKQQDKGTIRPDVEAEKLIFMLLQVQNGSLDFLSIVHGTDFEDNVRSGRPLFTIPIDILRKELESFVELMRHGFAAPTTAPIGGSG